MQINYDKKVTNEFGDIFYYLNGQFHRLDGPAIEYADGDKSYYVNGQRHRLDGPAIEYANGGKSYFVNGQYLSESEFNKHPEVVAYRKRQKLLKALE